MILMRRSIAVLVLLMPAAALAAEPELAISINSKTYASIEQGWPVIVLVDIANPDEEEALLLAPANGNYAGHVHVTLAPGPELARTAEPPEPTLSLPRGASTHFFVVLDEAQSARLAPGEHRVDASFTIDDGPGWHGTVETSASVTVKPTGEIAPADSLEPVLLRARFQLVRGDTPAARSILEHFAARNADSVPALCLLAEIEEADGDVDAAYGHAAHALGLALADTSTKSVRPEPPAALLILRKRLFQKLLETEPQMSPIPPAGQATAVALAMKSPETGPQTALDTTPETVPGTPPLAVDSATIVANGDVNEADVLADPRGQWAATATASSEYAHDRYSAMQATGPPDVDSYSDNPKAWCHSTTSNGEDWLELTYEQPMVATELRVRQNYTPGTLARVEAYAADGRALVLWAGEDPNVYPERRISWFDLRFPPPPFAVSRIRVTLAITRIGGWKQIDAVQLVGDRSDPP